MGYEWAEGWVKESGRKWVKEQKIRGKESAKEEIVSDKGGRQKRGGLVKSSRGWLSGQEGGPPSSLDKRGGRVDHSSTSSPPWVTAWSHSHSIFSWQEGGGRVDHLHDILEEGVKKGILKSEGKGGWPSGHLHNILGGFVKDKVEFVVEVGIVVDHDELVVDAVPAASKPSPS